MEYVISSYFECRMENRNARDQANQDEERTNEEWMVVDEWEKEASDATSASAGNGLIQFYYSLINIDE